MTKDAWTRVCEAVEEVARFADVSRLERSPFHLSPCGGCGCPSFQQPCRLCGYYPMGGDKGRWSPVTATREQFVSMVERSGPGRSGGTIATWHVRSRYDSAAWARRHDAHETAEEEVRRAALLPMPSADDVWDVVAVGRETVPRREMDRSGILGWSGIEEIRRVASDAADRLPPSVVAETRSVASRWAEAVHADDAVGMAAALESAEAVGRRMRGAVRLEGNLNSALRNVEAARDSLPSAAPAL